MCSQLFFYHRPRAHERAHGNCAVFLGWRGKEFWSTTLPATSRYPMEQVGIRGHHGGQLQQGWLRIGHEPRRLRTCH